uniref:Prohormone-4-like protein n=1 Tax=Acartia pacifica TaxID=335913 RepID=R9TIL0_ACAPC|nr:prohormone-4-like protein [Acartia pacifica]
MRVVCVCMILVVASNACTARYPNDRLEEDLYMMRRSGGGASIGGGRRGVAPSSVSGGGGMAGSSGAANSQAGRAKRFGSDRPCPAFEPFRCPEEGRCISIQYLCDGAPDCSDSYDEDPRLCTAARRPPVEETSSFLKSLLASHGPDYLEKLFGVKARNNLEGLGGVENVAIALSESQTIEDFGHSLKLSRPDIEHLRSVFMAVENGDIGMLKSLGIKDSELGDVKFFLEKLVNTGFLD